MSILIFIPLSLLHSTNFRHRVKQKVKMRGNICNSKFSAREKAEESILKILLTILPLPGILLLLRTWEKNVVFKKSCLRLACSGDYEAGTHPTISGEGELPQDCCGKLPASQRGTGLGFCSPTVSIRKSSKQMSGLLRSKGNHKYFVLLIPSSLCQLFNKEATCFIMVTPLTYRVCTLSFVLRDWLEWEHGYISVNVQLLIKIYKKTNICIKLSIYSLSNKN